MSPEIYINHELIADIPDENGAYQTSIGEINVDVDGIAAGNETQEIVVQGKRLKGKRGKITEDGTRKIQLSRKGIGEQALGSTETLTVILKNRPIWRVHQRGTTWYKNYGSCFTSSRNEDLPIYEAEYHPKWQRNH